MAKLDKVSMSHVADSIQKQTIFYYPVSDRNSGSLLLHWSYWQYVHFNV